jgi:D-inositol-3-phosphate glycosyltransferase
MSEATKAASTEPPTSRSIKSVEVSRSRKSGFSHDSQLPTLNSQPLTCCRVSLLTGGGDKPYALGMAAALTSVGMHVDFIGSDDLSVPELLGNSQVNFRNLRGDQSSEAGLLAKVLRVLSYYEKLILYAATSTPKLFHILWNNKFELFDRTLLMLYYRMLGKKIVLTVHNVNAGKRDLNDSFLNRLSLRIQYNLCHHIFVHTEGMKSELVSDFAVTADKVSVIPFGINNTAPNTALTSVEAKRRLGVSSDDKTILFFGNIAPYKGLEYLVAAFAELSRRDSNYRLVIAGRPKGSENYWNRLHQSILNKGLQDRVVERIEHVPDDQTELYFKAADVLVLPYRRVFQSGVLFLGYSFGLPAVAADIGTLKEEIIEGRTGFVFKPQDPSDLANVITNYFESELFRDLETRRAEIKAFANERYSWDKVARATTAVYSDLLRT